MVEGALRPRGWPRGCREPDGQRLLGHMRSCLSWFLRRIPVAPCPAPAVAVSFAADSLAAALAGSTRAVFFLTTMMAVAGR